MKTLFFILITLCLTNFSFAQISVDSTFQDNSAEYESYMQKSLQKKKTSRTLLQLGGGMAVSGLSVAMISNKNSLSDLEVTVISLFVSASGVIVMCIAIPYAVSSRNWKRRALEVKPIVGMQNIYIPNTAKMQPAIGMVIQF